MNTPVLICPSYFGQRLDGIGRVTGAFATAMAQVAGRPPFIFSANDTPGACSPEAGSCFGRQYRHMLLEAFRSHRRIAGLGHSRLAGANAMLPVVCTHLGLSPVARILAARLGRPYVVFLHGVEAWRPLKARSRWGLRRASSVFVNSHYTLRCFRQHNAWARDLPSTLIPLGVPVEDLESGPAKVRGRDDPFVILTVGRMVREECYEGYRGRLDLYKGFKTVITAVASLRKAGVPAEMNIVGDGNARVDLESWVAEKPVAAHVRFCGRVPDAELRRHYAEADVFALASEGEGFGLVYVEAMAHGLPCIGVAAGATPEVVANDESGYIVRARDAHEIADHLYVLYANHQIRARLSDGAAARYRAYFTQKAFLDRIIAALVSPEAGRVS